MITFLSTEKTKNSEEKMICNKHIHRYQLVDTRWGTISAPTHYIFFYYTALYIYINQWLLVNYSLIIVLNLEQWGQKVEIVVQKHSLAVFSSIREHYILISYYGSVNYSLIIKKRVKNRCSLSTDDGTDPTWILIWKIPLQYWFVLRSQQYWNGAEN